MVSHSDLRKYMEGVLEGGYPDPLRLELDEIKYLLECMELADRYRSLCD